MRNELHIKTSSNGTSRRLAVAGDIDVETQFDLAHAIRARSAPGTTVVLDLSAATHLDSIGLACLLAARREADAGDWDFALSRDLSAAARRVLETTGVIKLLPLVD
jgi:anti-anti-sigma factor